MTGPLALYGHGLLAAGDPGHSFTVRMEDGSLVPVALERYTSPADPTDEQLLAGVQGPVLDVGCGPGRHLHALARRAVFALGVDLSPEAVSLARGGGGRVLLRSVFDKLPGAGSWQTALLLDGNIGIGGTPERLLRRVGSLLAASGQVLVEVEPPGVPGTQTRARLETDRGTSGWFPWARVSVSEIGALARQAGMRVEHLEAADDRWFTRLGKL